VVTFIGSAAMRTLNRRFMRHEGLTDVLSFRYSQKPAPPLAKPLVGEILIAPAAARRYAKRHGIPYRWELARYLIHGLLHWLGHDDRTMAQQRWMRALEDKLLKQCG
jgi:probable rRNA maturation factor